MSYGFNFRVDTHLNDFCKRLLEDDQKSSEVINNKISTPTAVHTRPSIVADSSKHNNKLGSSVFSPVVEKLLQRTQQSPNETNKEWNDRVEKIQSNEGAQHKEHIKFLIDNLLKQKFPNNSRIGKSYNPGDNGVVYKDNGNSHGKSVFKFEVGDNEHRLNNYINKNKLNNISILPKYHSTTQVGEVKYGNDILPVHMIHREDIKDLEGSEDETLSSDKQKQRSGLAYALHVLGHISAHHGNQVEASGNSKQSGIQAAEDMNANIENILYKGHLPSLKLDGEHKEKLDKAVAGLKDLASRGIFPCDMSAKNWGIRHGTDEVVMRDPGCFKTAHN